jgi:hypothetical protein
VHPERQDPPNRALVIDVRGSDRVGAGFRREQFRAPDGDGGVGRLLDAKSEDQVRMA